MDTSYDEIAPCPFCGSDNVYAHYARHEDGTHWPGCTECEKTLRPEEWKARVARAKVRRD